MRTFAQLFVLLSLSVPHLLLGNEAEKPANCGNSTKRVAANLSAKADILREKKYAEKKAQSLRETDLLEKIELWRGDRSSQSELGRSRQVLYLSRALEIDRPYTIIEKLKPLFKRIYESEYIVRNNRKLIKSKERQLRSIGRLNPSTWALQHQISKLKAESERARNEISEHIEQYSAAYSYLKAVSENDGPITEELGEAALDASRRTSMVPSAISAETPLVKVKILSAKENAKEVLKDLQPKYLIRHLARAGEEVEVPTLGELYRAFRSSPEARLYALKRERRDEFIMWLLTVSPSQVAFDGIELMVRNIKWLDKPGLKAFLNFLQQDKSRLIYSGDIARIMMSHGAPAKQLALMEEISAGSVDDGFLQTFAQGLESRNTWDSLYREAQRRNDQKLAEKMKKAKEVASVAGDVTLVRASGKEKLVHRFLNLVAGSLTLGGPAYFFIPDGKNDDEEPKPKPSEPFLLVKPLGSPVSPAPAVPSEEPKESEVLKEDLDTLIEALEMDSSDAGLLKKIGMN